MSVLLSSGTAVLIGSLPHENADDAAVFAMTDDPSLPTAPQLPHRGEGMLAQAADGIEGVTVGRDDRLVIDSKRFGRDSEIRMAFGADRWAGLLAFLSLVGSLPGPVKVQLTGPVTLALALIDGGATPPDAFDVARRAVEARARALMALFAARAPDTSVVAFVDEPGLTAWGHPRLHVGADSLVDLLAGVFAALAPAAAGVHCCGDTDWRLPVAAGAAVLSLPLDAAVHDSGRALPGFLEGGGWLAWGSVPTTGPVGDDPDLLSRCLMTAWLELAGAGCDPLLLCTQCLITPVFGLAGHGLSQAGRVVRLTAALAQRARDQAVAAGLPPKA